MEAIKVLLVSGVIFLIWFLAFCHLFVSAHNKMLKSDKYTNSLIEYIGMKIYLYFFVCILITIAIYKLTI